MSTHSERRDELQVPDAPNHGGNRATTELKEPHAALEHAFIDEFLAERGYTLRSINRLPPGDRDPLLRAAAAFATLKLAEIEARAHLVKEIE